jgi:SPP1 gp7 family putative phage head morphogenesis protein
VALPLDPRGRELVQLLERSKYERWLTRELQAVLLDGFREIVRVLTTQYATLAPAERDRLSSLFVRVNEMLAESYGRASAFSLRELTGLSDVEAAAARALLETVASGRIALGFGTLAPARVRAIAELPIDGLTLGEWWTAQARTMADRTRRQIQQGLLLGEGPREIARRIIPVRAEATTPAVYRQARAQAQTITRTATTAVSNEAAVATYQAAPDGVLRGVQFRATLDDRTSAVCRARDGKVYRVDDPKLPKPPLHLSCRSALVPVLNYRALGLSSPPGDGAIGFTDYATWLREQPLADQNAILGKGRAELWRSGKVTLADMVDADDRVITLKELRERYGVSGPQLVP